MSAHPGATDHQRQFASGVLLWRGPTRSLFVSGFGVDWSSRAVGSVGKNKGFSWDLSLISRVSEPGLPEVAPPAVCRLSDELAQFFIELGGTYKIYDVSRPLEYGQGGIGDKIRK